MEGRTEPPSGPNIHSTLHGVGIQNTGSGSIQVGGDVNISNPTIQEGAQCLRDLTLTDPSEDRNALKRKKGRRAANTCEWILGTETLMAWLDSTIRPHDQSTNVLWIYGNPGTGKSTMAIFLTEELTKIFSQDKTLVYFFCDSSFDTRKTATAVVRGLLLQLVQQHPQLLHHILPRYQDRGTKLFESFDAVWSIFESIATKFNGEIFCVIDALDECDRESQSMLLTQLESLQHSNVAPNLRVLIISRPYPEIRESLECIAKTADLAAFPETKQDISRFIDDRITALQQRKKYTSNTAVRVKQILQDKAQGTFLWVGLASEELSKIPSKDAVKFLHELPSGLHAVYKSLLDAAIQHQGVDNTIQSILNFVIVARRPLSVLELSEACKLHLDTDDIETRLQFTREEIALCRLIVIIQDDTVLLLHQSVKDFLTRTNTGYVFDELQAHADAAFRCLDKLTWHFGHEQADEILNVGFLAYSTEFWPDHARLAKTKFKVRDSDDGFFTATSAIRERWLKHLRWRMIPWKRPGYQFSLLHIAARWDLPALVDYAQSMKITNNGNSKRVSETGRSAIVFECTDSNGITPLEEAVHYGNTAIIGRLLAENAVLTEETVESAARNTNGEAVMKLFFDQREDRIPITEKVIMAAAENEKSGEAILKLLFDRRGDQIIITEAIVLAAARNKQNGETILKLFLDRYEDQVIITKEIVLTAAENEENGETILKLLLNRWGDQIIITETVVLAAAENEKNGEAILKLFFDRVTNIKLTREQGTRTCKRTGTQEPKDPRRGPDS